MKRICVSIFALFAVVCATRAKPLDSILTAASFPKTADDLTFKQRMDVLADGYNDFDTVFDSNGVCIKNCPYVGITLQEFNKRIEQTAQQVEQDLAAVSQQQSVDTDATSDTEYVAPDGSVVNTETVNTRITNYLAEKVRIEAGVDVTTDTVALQRLRTVASQVQSDLLSKRRANVDLSEFAPLASSTRPLAVSVDVSDFEETIQEYFERRRQQEKQQKQEPPKKQQKQKISNEDLQNWFNRNRKQESTVPGDSIPTTCPLSVSPVRVSSEMGRRWGRNHNGIDLSVSVGTPVYAAADGVVVVCKNEGAHKGYGNYLVIQHAKNYYTVYGHLNKWLVSDGQYVRAGQQIAQSGNTGHSTGPHLHFEVLKNAKLVRLGATPVDPRQITNCSYDPSHRR